MDQFHNSSKAKDGKRARCKQCTNADNRQDYEQNRDQHLATKRQWKRTNQAYYTQQQKEAYQTNRETRRQKLNARRQANLEKYRKIELDYHKANPTVCSKATAKRRARKLNAAVVEDIDRRVVYDRDRGVCYLCHTPVEFEQMHLEHVVPLAHGGNHSYTNVKTACAACNLRKGVKSLEAFRAELVLAN